MASRTRLADRVTDQNVKWFTLAAACFGLFMAMLDNLVVNVALPTIRDDLNASTTQLQWIVSAYTLVFASLQITAGGLGDRFGRKRWFLIGLGGFTITSAFAALSQNIEMLIAARAIQGLFAALVMPLTLSLISEAFPPEERGKALGIWSAISVSGIALGPVVGGALVEYASWHWVFLINVPIGIFAFFLAMSVVRESRDTSGTVATDVPGTLLITGAIASLTYGLIEAGNRGWGDSLIVAALAFAVVLFIGFIAVEARTARPMVPLRFFRSSTFTGANIDAFSISFLLAGVGFFFTLYQQNIRGFSPLQTGLALIPMVIAMMILSPISGALINRVGSRLLISLGMIITGAGTMLLMFGTADSPYLHILPGLVVMGMGMSFIWAPMTTAVLNSVESEKSGVASAINGAIREIGTAFGIALLGTVMNRVYQAHYAGSADIKGLRAGLTPDQGAVAKVIDTFGAGAGLAGRVIDDVLSQAQRSQLGPVVDQIRNASAHAFVAGMDRAIIVSSAVIVVASVVSYLLVKDSVADAVPAHAVPAAVAAETEDAFVADAAD